MRITSRPGTIDSVPGNVSPAFDGFGDVDETINDRLTLVESPHSASTYDTTITQSLVLVNTAAKSTRKIRNINDLIVLVQSTVRGFRPTRNISDTLSALADLTSCLRVKERNVSETISLLDVVDEIKYATRSIIENLALDETPNQGATYTRSINEIINLIGGYTKTLRNVDYIINEVEIIKVPKKCTVVFECEDRLISLPCPEFNDTEKLLHSMTVKRSMTNVVYTYVRRNQLEQLGYSFVMGYQLAENFKDFIEATVEKILTLRNWKGELWKGYITTNPVQFTPKSRYANEGERVEVAIEFQGIRLL